jgi:hypothetical protein
VLTSHAAFTDIAAPASTGNSYAAEHRVWGLMLHAKPLSYDHECSYFLSPLLLLLLLFVKAKGAKGGKRERASKR